jgi:hypothetical protein
MLKRPFNSYMYSLKFTDTPAWFRQYSDFAILESNLMVDRQCVVFILTLYL